MQVIWLRHASFLIRDGCVIYIDPWDVDTKDKADIILVTHDHYDHCDPGTIRGLLSAEAVIIAPSSCKSKLTAKDFSNVRWVKPGDSIEVKSVKIEAVPAYNITRSFHPKTSANVGYVITAGKTRIYHAGDTDFIPEMKSLGPIDVALLPVSGTYVMSAEEASEAANSFRPKKVIPMHYGSIVGSRNDAIRFRSLTHCEVEIQEGR
ncbi:MAG: MBL fold metallo-hydrolase [Candidatus Omnitrophica bacterium]|nr:MBL fold metallo-hydrolase [Candidatus Omnitrophota bacterium]